MPRDIPVGNGQMLVTFDHNYQIRDLYFPHVGQENHAGGQPCRFGVWGTIPQQRIAENPKEKRRKRMYWSDKGWHIERKYQDDTLATRVEMVNDELMLKLICTDVVDYHRPIMVRRIEVVNLADEDREVRLLHHHDFQMYGFKVGDTAYYDPQLRSVIHYRKERYITSCFYLDGEQQTDQYATGNAGFGGAEGTWRDAEDGVLGMNPIAQGAVDSTILCSVQLPANDTRVAYLVIGCGKNYTDCEEIHTFLHREGPQNVIDRTQAYWKLWLAATRTEFGETEETGLSKKVYDLYKRSLLTVRTQIDNGGAIIAANDSDYLQFSRDTYSYLWPRDGAFVADAMAAGGFPDVSRSFYKFCSEVITRRGMFLHKYTPDGSPASSWHPWVDAKGRPQMPIQEDETALVIWSLWRHYVRYRDIEFVRPMWVKLVQPAAEFMVRYRDPDTKLPLPSYDLWEERWGVHAFTVASVYAGLKSAWQFAVCFGDQKRARRYAKAASEVREAFCKHMWSEKHERFLRRIEPADTDRIAEFMADIFEDREPRQTLPDAIHRLPGVSESANGWSVPSSIEHKPDEVLDASMFAIFALGLLPANDERVVKTMLQIEDRLTCKTDVGGVARYEDDYYHQVSQDTDNIPGNPWFICTLWMADYKIAKATNIDEVKQAATYLEWVADRALPSGCLAEQVHPETNAPLSVSPLTWSHATVVATLVAYLNKIDAIKEADRTGHAIGAVMPEAATVREGQSRHAIIDAVPELG
ncbi:MAG: glycoside hydrolase family 15 protein [Phycisphaeraceae bacterium]|jgi:oligosaccharide amylase